MIPPSRWSEDQEASQEERDLLLAGQAVRMSDVERRALWASIALSVPELPAPSNEPGLAPAAKVSLGAYLTKGLVFLATVAGLGVGGAWLLPRVRPTERIAPAIAVAAHSAAVAAPTIALATPEPTGGPVAPEPSLEPSNGKPRSPAASQLREESAAVLAARAELRAGDAKRCLELLAAARARFPHGVLGQEREALTIEALMKSGRAPEAHRRALAFRRAHPTSPYLADISRVSGE